MAKSRYIPAAIILTFCMVIIGGCKEVEKHIADLSTADQQTREQALMKLQQMGPKAADAIPALERATTDEDPRIRRLAIEALGAIGDDSYRAVKSIVDCMEDTDLSVRRAATDVIGRFHKMPSYAMPILEKSLGDEDEIIRKLTMSIYVDLGGQSVRSLMRSLENGNTQARRAAVQALGMMGDDAIRAKSLLQKISEQDGDKQTRESASKALLLIAN